MDDTVTGLDVSSNNIGDTSLVVDLNTALGSLDQTNQLTPNGGNITSGNSSSRHFGSNNMPQNNFFGLVSSEALQGTSWKLSEGIIRWGKDSEGFRILEGVNQAKV